MFGLLALIVALFSLLLAGGGWTAFEEAAGSGEAEAVEPAAAAAGAVMTMILVERADSVTNIDLGEPGPSHGDMIVWGPDPLYDETNSTDTGATTQGACIAFNGAGDCVLNETIVFPDGSTIELQGVQPGEPVLSTRTIVGGSGEYLGATGAVTVEPTTDLATWTKTFEIHH